MRRKKQKPRRTIRATCPTCKQRAVLFTFAGVQPGGGIIKDYAIYTCGKCHTTLSEHSLRGC